MSGNPECNTSQKWEKAPLNSELTEEEFSVMKAEADQVLAAYNKQQEEKKMAKDEQESSENIKQHKLLAMGRKAPQGKQTTKDGKKK